MSVVKPEEEIPAERQKCRRDQQPTNDAQNDHGTPLPDLRLSLLFGIQRPTMSKTSPLRNGREPAFARRARP
jgi:hypothetical protein